jgi:hypothetical protein
MPGQKREARLRARCPGHPRLRRRARSKTWWAGSKPGHDDVDGSSPTTAGMRQHSLGSADQALRFIDRRPAGGFSTRQRLKSRAWHRTRQPWRASHFRCLMETSDSSPQLHYRRRCPRSDRALIGRLGRSRHAGCRHLHLLRNPDYYPGARNGGRSRPVNHLRLVQWPTGSLAAFH